MLSNSGRLVFYYSVTKPNDPSIDNVVATAEFAKGAMASRLNWLRAAILGANDGIMSTSGMVLGVAAAPGATAASILIAGTAAIVAGSFSMAGGEYTSVSAQRDSEKSAIDIERAELKANPEGELRELAWFYEQKGISPALAIKVVRHGCPVEETVIFTLIHPQRDSLADIVIHALKVDLADTGQGNRCHATTDIHSNDVGDDRLTKLTGKTDNAPGTGMSIRHNRYESMQRRMVSDQFDLLGGNRVQTVRMYLYRAFVFY